MKKLLAILSGIICIIFHPLLIPTWAFVILGNTGFYFSVLPWSVKKSMFFVVFLSTCALPALSAGILALNPKLKLREWKSSDRILPLLLSAIFYYLGYVMLERMPLFPVFNLFLIAAVLVQIALIIASVKWNVSVHTAAIGALIGGFIAISSRLHENPLLVLSLLVLIAGVVATSRLILQKNNNAEVYSGFLIGFLILNLVVTFI
ncbi:MAG: hypothetical protein ACM3P1_13420 [Candidatus Saccharibacteria bacterium]